MDQAKIERVVGQLYLAVIEFRERVAELEQAEVYEPPPARPTLVSVPPKAEDVPDGHS